VKAGEILALIGPNGAGKSTMFNQLSGVDTPTSGEVLFRGKSVAGHSSREIAALGMSRTFQHVRLLPKMTVLENVAIGAHRRGSKGVLPAPGASSATRRRACCGGRDPGGARRPGGLHARRAGSLALGQQRILEIARALCSDPACCSSTSRPPACAWKKQALAELLRKLKPKAWRC
jgi:branched-chain amino acid transport system permease protein